MSSNNRHAKRAEFLLPLVAAALLATLSLTPTAAQGTGSVPWNPKASTSSGPKVSSGTTGPTLKLGRGVAPSKKRLVPPPPPPGN